MENKNLTALIKEKIFIIHSKMKNDDQKSAEKKSEHFLENHFLTNML